MHVCLVVTLASARSRYGGPFDVVREQGALAARAGHRVELVAGWTAGDRGPDFAAGTSSYRRLRRWLPTKDFTGLMSLPMLRQLWTSVGRADVVHISLAREAVPVAALAIAVLRRRPIIAQPHGMLTSGRSRLHDMIDTVLRPLLRRVRHWVALTPVEARALRARFGDTITTVSAIGNPIAFDATEAHHLRADGGTGDRAAVFIARLHPRKQVLDFAAAARAAAAKGWTDRYRVLGPDQGDLPALLQAVDRLPQLTYDGALDSADIPAFVARSGVFVLTSRDEPWGNVLATAAALGVPCVVTRSSALAEVLDGAPGVRVIDDGDAEAIAIAVHELMDAGHVEPSRLFDRDEVGRQLDHLYRTTRGAAA